ncbi:hypothetical protein COCOBI_pt-0850 (chloroplast) [Coccomyxa sp. Obi]|nr:hypothetical protein COCOBI_pt-0850 [Coccomyxa sp. Obi]
MSEGGGGEPPQGALPDGLDGMEKRPHSPWPTNPFSSWGRFPPPQPNPSVRLGLWGPWGEGLLCKATALNALKGRVWKPQTRSAECRLG